MSADIWLDPGVVQILLSDLLVELLALLKGAKCLLLLLMEESSKIWWTVSYSSQKNSLTINRITVGDLKGQYGLIFSYSIRINTGQKIAESSRSRGNFSLQKWKITSYIKIMSRHYFEKSLSRFLKPKDTCSQSPFGCLRWAIFGHFERIFLLILAFSRKMNCCISDFFSRKQGQLVF